MGPGPAEIGGAVRTDSAWYEVSCNGTFTMYYVIITPAL